MVNLKKLTPEPWIDKKSVHGNKYRYIHFKGSSTEEYTTLELKPTDARFIALARKAFGIMMRRGWQTYPLEDGWWEVANGDGKWWGEVLPPILAWSNPFTALVEADKWYVKNVERKSNDSTT